MNLRIGLIILSLIACLGLVNYSVVQREEIINTGRVVYLELAPVDPRSLLQGDYMRLNYETFPSLYGRDYNAAARGALVLTIDEQNIGTFSHFEATNQALAANQQRLKYRTIGYRVKLATDTFFFEEGAGARFAAARYAELHINEVGEMALVGLRDKNLQLIK